MVVPQINARADADSSQVDEESEVASVDTALSRKSNRRARNILLLANLLVWVVIISVIRWIVS